MTVYDCIEMSTCQGMALRKAMVCCNNLITNTSSRWWRGNLFNMVHRHPCEG